MNRRSFLRGVLGGAVISIGLPPLEAMFDIHGEALADGSAMPDRFGLWFWGNGTKPDRWVPTSAGTGWEPSSELEPLRDLRPYLSLVTGCEIKTATHPHHSGMSGILTGSKYHQLGTTRDTIVSTLPSKSVDMLAADAFIGRAPLRSLEIGVTRFHGTDEGTSFQHLSHNGPNNPNPSEYDAAALFERLFGAPIDNGFEQVRLSVLDAVRDQAKRLEPKLGAADRIRLDQHLSSIRALEQRLRADTTGCDPGTNPGNVPDVGGLEQIEQKNQVMTELLRLALACDLTRVFSVQFSTCGSGVVMWQVGATDSLHYTCHTEGGIQPVVHAATVFTMSQLAHFLDALQGTPEGSGNLLDSCSILCTSELSDGQTHSNKEFPILIAGKGNGRLRGNEHYRSISNRNTSDAVLTALRGAGVPVSSFGTEDGYTESVISQLM